MQKSKQSYLTKLTASVRKILSLTGAYWSKNIWRKIGLVLASIVLLWVGAMYGIAQWYIHTSKDKPLVLGTSFIPAYAQSLGVEPEATMDALINDLGVRHFRLVSYWNQIEDQPGQYDFSVLDWQFKKAEAAGAKVTLSVGLRQPRWPECHGPQWISGKPVEQWQPHLETYIGKVVERYKDSPALDSYQLENEFFLKGFGTCENWDRERLVSEYNLIKKLDPDHQVIISRSNNAWGWPVGEPTPDKFGISIYKRVWDSTVTKRYLEYPFPAWFYASVAGWQKIMTDRDMIIHELQAESWGPNGKHLSDISVEEANKSFNAERFKHRVEFGKATGMREIYLWGSEYWYYRMVVENDPSLWNVAKQAFQDNQTKQQ